LLNEKGLSWTIDHMALKPGRDWQSQFREVIDAAEHLVLVLTPAFVDSGNCGWEWEYARSQGKQVSAVRGAALDDTRMPRWMWKAHRTNLAIPEQRDRFLSVLRGPPRIWKVPFEARWPEKDETFIERPALLDEAKRLLTDSSGDGISITVALRGSPGFGKTGLAERICRDQQITDAFYDGVLWVQLGDEATEAGCIDHLNNQTLAVTGKHPQATTLEAAREAFGKALDNRRCLLVIDDAWHEQFVRPFLRTGSRDQTARLITTRLEYILPNCASVRVDAMQATEALERLIDDPHGRLTAAQVTPLRENLQHLAAVRLGGWVQALGLANGFLQDRVRNGQSLADALGDLSADLDSLGVDGALDHADEKRRQKTLKGTIDVSLQQLDSDGRRRFVELTIFAGDADITLAGIAMLWGTSDPETDRLCSRLRSLNLLQSLDLGKRILRLHGTMREVLGKSLDPAMRASLHARFVEAWRDTCNGNWQVLQDDYALRYLPWHLADAGQTAALQALLVDAGWMTAKLQRTGIQALLSDYRQHAAPPDGAAGLLGLALDLSAGPLANDPDELPGQMIGRLAPDSAPDLAAALDAMRLVATPRVLMPVRPTMTPPGAELRRLEGHIYSVQSVAVLPGGRVVSGSVDKTVRIWDAATGQERGCLVGHEEPVNSVAVLPNRHIVSGSADRTVRVWNPATGKDVKCLTRHTAAVNAVAVLLDGRIVSGAADATVHVWNSESGAEMQCATRHTAAVNAVAVLAEERIVSGSADKTIRVWNAATGEEVLCLEGHSGPVNSVAVLRDGRIVSGSADQTVRIWNTSIPAEVLCLTGHTSFVNSVAVLPDECIASGSADKTVRVWDATTGEQLLLLAGHAYSVNSVAALPDRRIVSGAWDRAIRVWDATIRRKQFASDKHTDAVNSVAMLSDEHIVSASADRTLRIWDMATGQALRVLTGHTDAVNSVAVLPGGRAVSGAADRTVRVWDAASGEELLCLNGHALAVNSVAVLSAERIVSASADETVRIWDARSGEEKLCLTGHSAAVNSVAVLRNGLVVSGAADRTVRVWDATNGHQLSCLSGHASAVNSITVLLDELIVSGSADETVRIWDATSFRELYCLTGHTSYVNTVAILPDRCIASGSFDQTVRVWGAVGDKTTHVLDMPSGDELSRLVLDAPISAMAVSREGCIIAGDSLGRLHVLTRVGAGSADSR
jgi:WD40 repeat protein